MEEKGGALMKPRRIQLSRRKGWRLPACAVVVSRPRRFSNPSGVPVTSDRLGAERERARIRRAQSGPLRSLRDLAETTDCAREAGLWGYGRGVKARVKHAEDCGYGQLARAIHALAAATRETP